MRVLHVVQTPLDYTGGPATYVREFAKRLAVKGINVGIVSPTPTFTKEVRELIEKFNVNLYAVTSSIFPKPLLRTPLIFSVEAHKTLSDIAMKYDIINVHVESTLLQSMLRTFRNRTIVTTVHGFSLYEDYATLKHGLDILKTLHLFFVAPQHCLSLMRLIDDSKAIITVSNSLKELIINTFHKATSKIMTIPNAVDTESFKPRELEKARTVLSNVVYRKCRRQICDEHIILYSGRLASHKGIDVLLKSLPKTRVDSLSIVLAGDGDQNYISYLKDLASKLGIADKICFAGKVPHSLLPYLYAAASLFVLPSIFEGLPTAILEAMSCGVPSVASRIGGISEVIDNYVDGILVSPGSSDGLANAITYLLENYDLRKKMGQNARRKMLERFDWNIVTDKIIRTFLKS
jgi:glycosyltransferase involved in cell wall biosynthesis